jgi:hypothetical protein
MEVGSVGQHELLASLLEAPAGIVQKIVKRADVAKCFLEFEIILKSVFSDIID